MSQIINAQNNIVLEPGSQMGQLPDEPYSRLSLRAAEVVSQQLRKQPTSRLGMPTGRTPTGCYKVLSRWSQEGRLDWSQVECFGLDEYYDVDEPASFRNYLEQNLYANTNLPKNARFNPLFFNDYDGLIASKGGLDLTLLGIGKNGHIAFNEPGTPLDSWTHSVSLTESTREANAEFFKRAEQIPKNAITMGIRTVLASRQLILLASGKQKKAILDRALNGPVTADVPASFLQLHKNLQVMTDFED